MYNGELDRELSTYARLKGDLLRQHPGEYALITGTELLGTFESQLDAVRSGYERVGNRPFLVRKIQSVEPVLNLLAW